MSATASPTTSAGLHVSLDSHAAPLPAPLLPLPPEEAAAAPAVQPAGALPAVAKLLNGLVVLVLVLAALAVATLCHDVGSALFVFAYLAVLGLGALFCIVALVALAAALLAGLWRLLA